MELAAGVWRVRADNPSPMTGSGTNTYVVHGPAGAVVRLSVGGKVFATRESRQNPAHSLGKLMPNE